MVDEFEFFRKVQTYYQHVPFSVQFTYRVLHKTERTAHALGRFCCRVDPHQQIVEYNISLESDVISRPFSEKVSFLFSSKYDEIPPQRIVIDQAIIYQLNYPVPILYDWKMFIIEGANEAISIHRLQPLFEKYKLAGADGQLVDAKLKVARAQVDWYNVMG
ncbi:hypothetical protein [Paenibacillus sp. NEAU-GSW1]|uniref:hypothetical protein n=1 Tax=Paenibacillus sp. NEAU-GSW1 TaxID=2682486 RepID=UPI0012E22DAF|nr:hypothetical protein [Paenibacillus sp. NEAU-GSW1]MUT64458.1 hypothetical protein [Paenibacillus sp. NEAU-GSW1]